MSLVFASSTAATASVAIGFRFVLAFIFGSAALPKLAHRREFARAVENYALLPGRAVGTVARLLPLLELACALALLIGFFVRATALIAAALLVGFSVAVAINLARGRRIDCGCEGEVSPRKIGWGLVAADLVLAAMATTVAFFSPRPGALVDFGDGAGRSVQPADLLALVLLAGVAFLAEQIILSFVRLRSVVAAVDVPERRVL